MEHGFHQTGINQIASLSDVRVAQLYRDFENKEAIVAAVCEEQLSVWMQEDVLAGSIAMRDTDAIWTWFEDLGRKEPGDCRLMLEILAEAGRNERIAAICRRADRRAAANIRRAVEAVASPRAADLDVSAVSQRVLGFATAMPWWRLINPDRGCAAQMAAIVRDSLAMPLGERRGDGVGQPDLHLNSADRKSD